MQAMQTEQLRELETPGTPSQAMAERVRAFDWSSTVLGPMETWPPALRTAGDIFLNSPVPMSKQRVRFVMTRNGYPEETFFSYSHSPIPDGKGGIGGLFQVCTDETV